MNCRCKCSSSSDMLKIPYGNPFRLCICRSNVAPGNPDDITFADIDGLQVLLSRIGIDTPINTWEVMDNGDMMLTIGANDVEPTAYGIVMAGTYQGKPWRWRGRLMFEMVYNNADSPMEPSETFGIETYYIQDVLWVETEGDTAYFITHGHADIRDGALILQETADTSIEIDGDKLIITQNRDIWNQ